MKLAFLAATMALGACQHIFEAPMNAPVRNARKWERSR
jgi:hypothetical protein